MWVSIGFCSHKFVTVWADVCVRVPECESVLCSTAGFTHT